MICVSRERFMYINNCGIGEIVNQVGEYAAQLDSIAKNHIGNIV